MENCWKGTSWKHKKKSNNNKCLAVLESQQPCTKINRRLLFENGEINLVPRHDGIASVYNDTDLHLYPKQNNNKVP